MYRLQEINPLYEKYGHRAYMMHVLPALIAASAVQAPQAGSLRVLPRVIKVLFCHSSINSVCTHPGAVLLTSTARGESPAMHLQPGAADRHNIRTAILALFALALAAAFLTACGGGGSLAGGGDPLSVVAPKAFELELYNVDTYLDQDLPDALRKNFTDMQRDFERFGVNLSEVDQFVKVVLDCCSYRKVVLAPGPRVYVFDGSIDLGLVRDKLEEGGFESREYGDYEAWERRALAGEFRRHDDFAAAFLTEEGYLVMGDVDGIRELVHEFGRTGEKEGESAMERVLARVGDGWKGSGRLDAQTNNNMNTHCAQSFEQKERCDATAGYTSYSETPLRTELVAVYGSADDAQSGSEKIESNFEASDYYVPVEVEVVDVVVDGRFVEATIEHDVPLLRRWTTVH